MEYYNLSKTVEGQQSFIFNPKSKIKICIYKFLINLWILNNIFKLIII